MLSRVAEQLYWYGRHVERAENTARLVNVNADMLMDLPRPFKRTWANMIGHDGEQRRCFTGPTEKADEKNVLQFMLADEANPSSMACCVRMAREERPQFPGDPARWKPGRRSTNFTCTSKKNLASDLRPGERHKYLEQRYPLLQTDNGHAVQRHEPRQRLQASCASAGTWNGPI